MSEKRAYNLLSGGSETLILPVQIQVTDDRFMLDLLQCHQNTTNSDLIVVVNLTIVSNAESDIEQTVGSENKYQVVLMKLVFWFLGLFLSRQ